MRSATGESPRINVRVDKKTRKNLEKEATSLGLDLSSYLRLVVTRRDILRLLEGGRK